MDDEDLNDIFADYEEIRNSGDLGEVNNEQTGANETESSQAAAVRKRIVQKPRLKFNADRLCSERGIPSLEKHFENVVFNPEKGHEKENLDKLLGHLEHWTHRLFPSLKFSESLTHIEKLGKKKSVQVCVKKLRLGMPILSDDFIHDADDGPDDTEHLPEVEVNNPMDSAFDQLMREHRETFPGTDDIVSENTAVALSSSPMASYCSPTLSPPRPVAEKEDLTEEQKQRIERNKMLAAERRKSRLAAMSNSLTSDISVSVISSQKEVSGNILHDHETVHDTGLKCSQSLSTYDSDEVSVPGVHDTSLKCSQPLTTHDNIEVSVQDYESSAA